LCNDDFDGQVQSDGSGCGHARVRAVAVDELASQFGVPDVLFIDVEGFETQVLRGASRTLATRPDCFVEVHVGEGLEKFESSADQVLGFFPGDDYDIYLASESQREMKPLAQCRNLMSQRFFMVCLARR